MNNAWVDHAIRLLSELGLHQLSDGSWSFTDLETASYAHVHHSREPAAVAGYAVVNPIFAAGRFPGYALIDMVNKVPCMDAREHTALAMVCGAPIPTFPCSVERGKVFGQAVWEIVEAYSLQGCFDRLERAWGSPGLHYHLRPRGFDWRRDEKLVPEAMTAMRKTYRTMSPLQQIMVLTILHLYYPHKDDTYLTRGCPTKISAAEAMDVLHRDGTALPVWGHLVTHYAGW